MSQPSNKPNPQFIGAGIAIGAGIGAALGVVFGNIAIGVSLGVAFGVVLGAAMAGATEAPDYSFKGTTAIVPMSAPLTQALGSSWTT